MREFLPDQKDTVEYYSSSDEDEINMEDDIDLVFLVQQQPGQPQQLNNSVNESNSEDDSNNIVATSSANTNDDGTQQVQKEEEKGNWYFSDEDEEETGATMEEVFEIEPAIEASREQPPDILVGAEVIDVKFHPNANIVAVATLDAEVVCYSYDTKETKEVHSSEHHDLALRSIRFNSDGRNLLTVSKDKSVAILDTNTWTVKHHIKDAHESSIYSVCSINDNLFATGDDDGILKLWDMRKQNSIFDFRCGEETINDIICDDDGKIVVAAVNDGSISAFNASRRKLIVQSEMYDYPLSCLAVVRNGTRLAVGSENGNLHIFKWGEFGYHADCVTEQPQQINCMEAIGDNRVITGCEDGYVRAINLDPHRFVGVIGRHQKYGIEAISISYDQRYLASCCNDDTVQFWDLQHLYNVETDEKAKGVKVRDLRNNLLSSRERNITEFFADMPADIPTPSEDEYRGPVDRPKNVED